MLDQIEKFLPDVEKLVSKNVLRNDKTLKAALSKGYGVLPFYVRMVIKEESFIKFCMENKHVLLSGKPVKKVNKKPVAKMTASSKRKTNK